jgi:hypothetical protein
VKFNAMAPQQPKKSNAERAVALAQGLTEALVRERIIPRFVDSYVVEHGRYALQVHAALYRDLLTLLQREALLAASVQILETATSSTTGKQGRKAPPMTRKEATAFRQKFLAAMTRQQHWNVTTALEFQSDLQLYENILARAHATRRVRKPFEAANHPFVDRSAFMLDSSFLENARVAASRALSHLEVLVEHVSDAVFSVSAAPRGK